MVPALTSFWTMSTSWVPWPSSHWAEIFSPSSRVAWISWSPSMNVTVLTLPDWSCDTIVDVSTSL